MDSIKEHAGNIVIVVFGVLIALGIAAVAPAIWGAIREAEA